jgi:Tfp pilus assembly protein PilZ
MNVGFARIVYMHHLLYTAVYIKIRKTLCIQDWVHMILAIPDRARPEKETVLVLWSRAIQCACDGLQHGH